MPTHAQVPPTQRQQTGRVNDLLPLGDWIRHHSLRSWPVLLFLALICVPSIALVILGSNPSASTFDHVAWIFAAYFAVAWLLLLGVIIRPKHVTRPTLVLVTVIALATQVPLAVTLEVDLHAETAGLGPSIWSVGLPEELAKAIPVLAVALIYRLWGRHELTPKDYLFLGAVSGLAFGASEVVHYFTVNGLAEFYLTVQSALPSIQQLILTGHSAPDSVFAVLIGPVRYFVLDFVLAIPHRPDHPRLLGRPDRLLHRAGGHRTPQVVHRELDRPGHRRDPARAERLEPGQRALAVDRGHHRQRHPVPGLREGRVPQRPGGFRPLAARVGAARPAARAPTRHRRRGAPALVGTLTGMDKRLRFMTDLIAPLKARPGNEVRLSRDHDPGYTGELARPQAAALLADGVELLADYQDRLAAQDTFGVLLVLQGLDAAGKDSTIKHVMSGVNPQAVEVRAFKQPSAEELNHDFLWRYQRALPGRGRIGIFNRSHYEEVLVVRVHEELLAAERMPAVAGDHGIWGRRYREINDWERYLVDNGIHVVKVMLNLSKREQAKRFLKRIDHPEKNWKFSPSDVRERRYWDDYQRAFEAMLSQTSTTWAPWYVVPADHKWFSRLATAAVLVTALDAINPRYPVPDPAVRDQMAQVREELAAELGTGS